jgi:hypothetical protein
MKNKIIPREFSISLICLISLFSLNNLSCKKSDEVYHISAQVKEQTDPSLLRANDITPHLLPAASLNTMIFSKIPEKNKHL